MKSGAAPAGRNWANAHGKSLGLGALISMILLSALLALMNSPLLNARLSDSAVLALYGALFLPWGLLIWRSGAGSTEPKFQIRWPHLIATGIIVRVLFLAAEPLLSDDIFRYVWDGRVAAQGINPFLYPPDSDALSHLRDASIWPHINHGSVSTIYPPGAQFIFHLNALLGGGTHLLRAIFLVIEAVAIGSAGWILSRMSAGFDTARLKLAFSTYALCPLVFVETAWSGHLDVVAWMTLILALILMMRASTKRALLLGGALFGASIATKLLGILAIPLILLGARSAHKPNFAAACIRRLSFLAVAAAIIAASYLPYMSAGPKLFSGFGTYASSWQSNAGPFRLGADLGEYTLLQRAPEANSDRLTRSEDKIILHFSRLDEPAKRLGFTRMWQGQEVPATSFAAEQVNHTLTKLVAAFLVGLAMLWAILVRRDLLAGTLLILLTLFFVAPVVHPWYVAWLLPFAALRRSPASLTFAPAVLLAYLAWIAARSGASWQVPAWALVLEFGAVGLVAWWFAGDDWGGDKLM